MRVPSSFAFVISQDGSVSAFRSDDKKVISGERGMRVLMRSMEARQAAGRGRAVSQVDASEIDSVLMKVNDKADNTMGIMVSMSGFRSVAIKEASFSKSPLLLLEHSLLCMVLSGIITFSDAIRRIRRHSSQEGKTFLPVSEFGGNRPVLVIDP
jgi:hypothetical protein